MTIEHLDVLVVGAGISGVCAGFHLQDKCPRRSYAILEARDDLGGTWDLFRYPGIRSDSDMYTLGYPFRPWTEGKAIADGPSIMRYLRETAREFGIDRKIRFGHRVKRAAWSSKEARWTVDVERRAEGGTERVQATCNFLFMCSGYYDYEHGYAPEFPGAERFRGRIVHPQFWTDDVDYAGKRVVVIGSGATAVTLVPELAKRAAKVTMLQRSPTYLMSLPSEDRVARALSRVLPARLAYGLVRWRNALLAMWLFHVCRTRPERAKRWLLKMVRAELGPDYDVAKHFTPPYKPWEQRLCVVPDSDFFKAIRSGRADVVTDHIETFNETGLKLRSGPELEADLVVTATGLDLKFLSGLDVAVDGVRVDMTKTLPYKGLMYSGVPNLASVFGYTNASWTLRADLVCRYVCRLLNHMERTGTRQCTPRAADATVAPMPWVDFSSGYFQRALHKFPQQGSKRPWTMEQNYLADIRQLRFGALEDGVLVFGR